MNFEFRIILGVTIHCAFEFMKYRHVFPLTIHAVHASDFLLSLQIMTVVYDGSKNLKNAEARNL